MDKIIIKGFRFFAYHGVNPEETEFGQHFEIDLTASVDLTVPCSTDDIDSTISYAALIKTIRRVGTAQADKLIERLAQRIADAVLAEYPPIQSVTLRLKKPDAPMKADFDYVAVEIERSRK